MKRVLAIMLVVSGSVVWLGTSEKSKVHGTRVLSEDDAAMIHGQGPHWPCETWVPEGDCPTGDRNHLVCEAVNYPHVACGTESGNCSLCSAPSPDQHCAGSTMGWYGCQNKVRPGGCGVYHQPGTSLCLPILPTPQQGPKCECTGVPFDPPIRCDQKYAELNDPDCGGA